jgi:hypothetical protein
LRDGTEVEKKRASIRVKMPLGELAEAAAELNRRRGEEERCAVTTACGRAARAR